MRSQIEVDKEDLYILKINFKGKRIVGKAKWLSEEVLKIAEKKK